ncbi:hypothetical protein EU805_17130 [Salipiger sp. IMCC34102]|uniref:hypothetical protein n=1 Tax=Salipiger sp. IMCC34102 TaxID=2510647 RepID=UPI00101CD756|nr:hypothetical protein [Salipiger sp. IMCC34102]RYH00687.1 hypothetical protein EU805_17130 [Salipiger sp. IMCC34102]
MTKTTYVATAPDGSEHVRKSERTYTHAVLVEGKEGWGAVGFCGRPDLAEKKCGEHPGSIVVECGVLGDRAADMPEAADTKPAATPAGEEKTVDQKIRETKVHMPEGAEPKQTIGSMVQELLIDPDLGYTAIVDRVMTDFPDAKTSVRSVASVAAVLRKKGVNIPIRRKVKSSDQG